MNFNMVDPRSVIQDSCPRVLGNLGSWIRHIETQCAQCFNVVLHGTLKYWAALSFNMVGLCGHEEMI